MAESTGLARRALMVAMDCYAAFADEIDLELAAADEAENLARGYRTAGGPRPDTSTSCDGPYSTGDPTTGGSPPNAALTMAA